MAEKTSVTTALELLHLAFECGIVTEVGIALIFFLKFSMEAGPWFFVPQIVLAVLTTIFFVVLHDNLINFGHADLRLRWSR